MSQAGFLQDKVALVTGGASGIGRAVALALADAGAAVAIGSLLGEPGRGGTQKAQEGAIAYLPSIEQMEQTQQALLARGGRAMSMALDVTSAASVKAFVERTVATLGRVDILVNAAGITAEHAVRDHPDELWNRVIDVNLTGAYRLIKACLPPMLERGWGRIVSIASTAASVGAPTSAAYAASKAGLLGLSRCVALEGAPSGVSCNTISPGWVNTSFGQLWMSCLSDDTERYKEEVRRSNPQRRIIAPEEIAALAVFLCREDAFGITSQDLTVSAGSHW